MTHFMRKHFVCVMVLISFVSLNPVFASQSGVDPVEVVRKFCGAEYNGIRDIRFKLVENSPARARKLKKIDPELKGNVVFWDADTIFVVSTFSVNGAIQKHSQATVPVIYDVVLKTRGDGIRNRTFIKNCAPDMLVRYNLNKKNGAWRIYDPPVPYISLDALINYYKNEVKSIPKDAKNVEKYTDVQRSAFKRLEEGLIFLEQVASKNDYCGDLPPENQTN